VLAHQALEQPRLDREILAQAIERGVDRLLQIRR
jgi:hypothetical protein